MKIQILKIIFSRTTEPISTKFGTKHKGTPVFTIKGHLIPEKEKCFVKFYVNVFIDWICFQVNIADSGPLVFFVYSAQARIQAGALPARAPPP